MQYDKKIVGKILKELNYKSIYNASKYLTVHRCCFFLIIGSIDQYPW